MKEYNIKLTKEESGYILYTSYKLKSIQNIIDAFIMNQHQLAYSDKHMDKLLDVYSHLFASLREYILKIAVREGIENIDINKYGYIYDKDILVFTM